MTYPESQGLLDYLTRIDEILAASNKLQGEIRDALLQLTVAIQALQQKPVIKLIAVLGLIILQSLLL